MSWHYLRELGGEFLEDICSGGEPLQPLRSKTIHDVFYCKGKLMDSYLDSLSGTTFAPLMENPGKVELTSSAGASLVRTFLPQEKGMDSMESGQDSGHKWRGWLAKFDPLSCSLKTAQCSLLGEEYESLLTLPRWGMTRHGLLWELPTLAHHTNGTEFGLLEKWATPACYQDGTTVEQFQQRMKTQNRTIEGAELSMQVRMKEAGLWPTPVHSEERQGLQIRRDGKKGTQTSLSTAVLTWPTPRTAGMCGGSGSWDLLNKNTTLEEARQMGAGNGGQLNPPWVEWLMGWPIGWTDLKPLAMDKSPSALPLPGDS